MIYTLMHFDTPLVVFSAEGSAEVNIKIIKVCEENKKLFPLDLAEISEKGIESWVRHRLIPKNRAYADALLSAMGLSVNRPFDIIRVSKGLSLNDCYWLKYDDFVCEAKKVLTHEQRNAIRKLLNFKLPKHSRYNLDKGRLKLVEYAVSQRAAEILGE